MKKFSTLLMFGCLLAMACVAFAAGDPTQPLFGWNTIAVGAVLGIASPYLTALFTKLNWSTGIKLTVLYVVSLVLTIIGGFFTGAITLSSIQTEGVAAIVMSVIVTGKITYDLVRGSVKVVAVATEPKKTSTTS